MLDTWRAYFRHTPYFYMMGITFQRVYTRASSFRRDFQELRVREDFIRPSMPYRSHTFAMLGILHITTFRAH